MHSPPGDRALPERANVADTPMAELFAEYLAFKSGMSDATLRAYNVDYVAITSTLSEQASIPADELTVSDVMNVTALRKAFGARFQGRPNSSLKRCWTTWNGLCEFLIDDGHFASNPMRKISKRNAGPDPSPPKSIETADVHRLLAVIAMPDPDNPNRWREHDLALVLSGLLLGLRTAEMIDLNIGDFSPRHDEPDAMTVTVLGKGGKYRVLTSEPALTKVLETYLTTRARHFPDTMPVGRRRQRNPWKKYDPSQPLFVGADGQRITRGAIQYRIKKAYALAGVRPTPGASIHRLRHTFAIQLAESGVSVHVLMDLLGHASMSSTQKYLAASGQATREASRSNPIYAALPNTEHPPK